MIRPVLRLHKFKISRRKDTQTTRAPFFRLSRWLYCIRAAFGSHYEEEHTPASFIQWYALILYVNWLCFYRFVSHALFCVVCYFKCLLVADKKKSIAKINKKCVFDVLWPKGKQKRKQFIDSNRCVCVCFFVFPAQLVSLSICFGFSIRLFHYSKSSGTKSSVEFSDNFINIRLAVIGNIAIRSTFYSIFMFGGILLLFCLRFCFVSFWNWRSCFVFAFVCFRFAIICCNIPKSQYTLPIKSWINKMMRCPLWIIGFLDFYFIFHFC